MVVVPVRVSADDVPVFGALVLVFRELPCRVRASLGVDDNLVQLLEPFHGILHAPGSLLRSHTGKPKLVIVCDALWLCRVGYDPILPGQPLCQQPFSRFLVALFVSRQLIEQIQGSPGCIVVHPVESERIRVIAPVQTVFDPVKVRDLIVRDLPDLKVLKHLRTASHGFAEVLMSVLPFVGFLNVLGFCKELFPQPFRGSLEVGAFVAQSVSPDLKAVNVRPIIPADRWVVALKIPEGASPTHGGLEDGADLFPPGELILFLKVRDGDVAERCFDGFQFHGIVCPTEEDPLPGGLVYQLHR